MTELDCAVPRRRERVLVKHRAGIDSVEAEDGGRTLIVTFLGRAPRDIHRHQVHIGGGRRIFFRLFLCRFLFSESE